MAAMSEYEQRLKDEVLQGEWISVEDRLPDDDEPVLVSGTVAGGDVIPGFISYRDSGWDKGGMPIRITHWMRPPPPPKKS